MKKIFLFALRPTALLCILGLSFGLTSCQTKCCAPKDAQAGQTPSHVKRIQNGVELKTGRLNVRVQFYADDCVRVLKWVAGGTSEKASLIVIQTNLPDLNTPFSREHRHRHAGFGSRRRAVVQERRCHSIPQRRQSDYFKGTRRSHHCAGQDQARNKGVQRPAEFQIDAR